MSKVMRTHTGITEWNGDFYCDVCGRRVKGITIVNGMDFCAKCYQETFGNNYSQISQIDIINAQYTEHLLKETAQLKEKFDILEQENKRLKELLNAKEKIETNSIKGFEKLKNENKQLKEQLAEKEQEVRKRVCEEVYDFIMDNWEKLMSRQGRYQNFSGTCLELKEDLDRIAKGGEYE